MSVLTPARVYDEYNTHNVPDSSIKKVVKAEVVQLLQRIEASSAAGIVVRATKAALDLVTPDDENAGGWVLNDATAANNGYYYRSGGAWVRGRGFPDTFARLSDVAGTNAVTASVEAAVDPSDVKFMVFLAAQTNTDAMTLAVSGETAKPLVGYDGEPLEAGFVQAGAPVLLYDDGDGNYRLLLDHRFQQFATQVEGWRDETEGLRDEADADRVAAEAARDVATGAMSAIVLAENTFATVATAEAWEPEAAPDYIRTAGYTTAGDGGGALYKKAASEPSHGGKFSITLSDGETVVWYELAEEVVTPSMFGASGGTSTDSYAKLASAATFCAAKGRVLYTDQTYRFDTTWTPPAGLILRGPWCDSCALFFGGGSGNVGIDVDSAIDVDGIVVDGGYTGARDVLSEQSTLVAIHGSMSSSPEYLSGVHIGRLKARRTLKAGIILANLDGLIADHLVVEDAYSQGILGAGLRDPNIITAVAKNVGGLNANNSRRGSGFMIAATPGTFGSFWDADNILPSSGGQIGTVTVRGATDSAVYFHDDMQKGVSDFSVGTVDVTLAGKDAVKVRSGATGVKIGTIAARKVANAGFIATGYNGYLETTNRISDISVGTITVEDCGYDAISEILGVTYGTTRYDPEDSESKSINDATAGISIENVDGCTIGSFSVKRVAATPAGAAGHGLVVRDSHDIKAAGHAYQTAGRALDVREGCTGIVVDIGETDCADPNGGGFENPSPVTNTTVYLDGSEVDLKLHTRQPTQRLEHAIVVVGGTVDFEVNDARSSYDLTDDLYVKATGGATTNYKNRPRLIVRESLSFDGNGRSPDLNHEIPGPQQPHITASDVGGEPMFVLKPFTVLSGTGGGTFKLSCYDLRNDVPVVVNTSRVITWSAEMVPYSTGWG